MSGSARPVLRSSTAEGGQRVLTSDLTGERRVIKCRRRRSQANCDLIASRMREAALLFDNKEAKNLGDQERMVPFNHGWTGMNTDGAGTPGRRPAFRRKGAV